MEQQDARPEWWLQLLDGISAAQSEGVDMYEPTLEGLLRVLDRAAITSRQLGTSLDSIAENMSLFLHRIWTLPHFRTSGPLASV